MWSASSSPVISVDRQSPQPRRLITDHLRHVTGSRTCLGVPRHALPNFLTCDYEPCNRRHRQRDHRLASTAFLLLFEGVDSVPSDTWYKRISSWITTKSFQFFGKDLESAHVPPGWGGSMLTYSRPSSRSTQLEGRSMTVYALALTRQHPCSGSTLQKKKKKNKNQNQNRDKKNKKTYWSETERRLSGVCVQVLVQ